VRKCKRHGSKIGLMCEFLMCGYADVFILRFKDGSRKCVALVLKVYE
jgi:hypothetical protein